MNFVARPRITLVAVLSIVLSRGAHACATCFGDPDSGQTVALNWAMGAMLGVTAMVLGGVGAFAYGVYRRSSAHAGESVDE